MRVKLLELIRSVDPAGGGPVESLKTRAAVLRAEGHEVEVMSLDPANAACVAEFPLRLHALGRTREGYGFSRGIVEWLQQHAPAYDAVIVHGLWQYHSLAAWQALHRLTVPYFVFPHGMLDPWFKRAYPLKHLKKWLYWPWAEYRVLRDARAVLFTCETERTLARQSFSLYRCREEVVDFGTNGNSGDSKAQVEIFYQTFPGLRERPFVLFLGRVQEKKGVDLLLRAWANLRENGAYRDHSLLIAGPVAENYQTYLSSLVRQLNITESVVWAGLIRGDLKWGSLHAAEVFVLPSHQENFGIAVAEALSCGLPVLISDKVNIWREVESAGAGLVASDDLAGTMRLLQRWQECPEQEQMRKRASALFYQRYEIKRVAEGFVNALRKYGVTV